MLVLAIDGNESGYSQGEEMWATPNVCGNYNRKGASATSGDGLATQAKERMWPTPKAKKNYPTPTASDWKGRGPNSRQQGLPEVVKNMWTTPTQRDYKGANNGPARGYGADLNEAVKMYPTPRSSSALNEDMDAIRARGTYRSRIEEAVAMWPTPCTRDHKDTYNSDRGDGTRDDSKLPIVVFRKEKEKTNAKAGKLNPDWVEWLMNWCIGWTRLEPITLDWRDISVDPADDGEIPRISNESKNRAARIKAIGNGQVPLCAATAFKMLMKRITKEQA